MTYEYSEEAQRHFQSEYDHAVNCAKIAIVTQLGNQDFMAKLTLTPSERFERERGKDLNFEDQLVGLILNLKWMLKVAGRSVAHHDDHVWPKDWDDCLCISCLERRLGRALTPDDFSDLVFNSLPLCTTRLREQRGPVSPNIVAWEGS